MSGIFIYLVLLLCVPCIAAFMVIPCYSTVREKNKANIYSGILAVLFSIVGYCFKNPATDPDIVRYIQMLGKYNGKTLFESFNLIYENLYSVDIWFYLISRFNDPQLLPASSMLIFYFIAFYVMADYKLRTGISNKNFTVFVIFVTCAINMGTVLNAIRSSIAFALFFLAIYRELIQNKRNILTYALYIVTIFMHFSVLSLIFLRLCLILKNRKLQLSIAVFIVAVPELLNFIGRYTLTFASSNALVSQLIYFVNRSNMYFSWNEGGWASQVSQSGYYKVERGYYLIVLLFFVHIGYKYYKSVRYSNMDRIYFWQSYQFFGIIYGALSLIVFLMTLPEYNRFITPFLPFLSVLLFDYWKGENDFTSKKYFFPLLFLAVGGIVINAYSMNVFLSIPEFIGDIISFSPVLGHFY